MENILSEFRARRAAQILRDARAELLESRHECVGDVALLQELWGKRVERVAGHRVRILFDRECYARRRLGEARHAFLSWRVAAQPQQARLEALRLWHEGASLLSAALELPEGELHVGGEL